MKKLARLLATILVILLPLIKTPTSLADINISSSQTPMSSPNILVTTIVGSQSPYDTRAANNANVTVLDDLEIYNQSNSPINLTHWSFNFIVEDDLTCSTGVKVEVPLPNSNQWILPKHYLTIARGGNPAQSDIFSFDISSLTSCTSSPWLSQIQLLDESSVEQEINIPATGSSGLVFTAGKYAYQHQRTNSTSSTRTFDDTFTDDYKLTNIPTAPAVIGLYSDDLYRLPTPADTAGLEIVEVYPNSPNCSPTDTSLLCNDYVKLYNSSAAAVDLSLYRLRTSYGGLSSSSSNTISLSTVLAAHTYTLINTRSDGTPLSLTESGGYVWLEDAEGAQIYQPVIEYPDASSTTKIGWSWALNGSTWQWSSAPQPTGKNVFPPAITVSTSSSSVLTPCATGQERNPATNRCRSILNLSASVLGACATGQERNPATNRCRSVLGASTSLSPCPVGQTRNPSTNRCRQDPNTAIANVQDVASQTLGSPSRRWLIAGGTAAGAVGYAAWEWRHEASLFLDKLKLVPTTARISFTRFIRRRK